MSIQQLRSPAMAGHVAAAVRAVEAAGRVPVGSLERGELGGLVSDLAALEAQVTALFDHARLVDQLASARLDTGTHVSAGEARRLACGARLLPAVLGSRSEVLDLGRVRRLHTPAQRRALSVGHESCAAEGCDRPFAWCEVHHPHAWSEGGCTDLDNALPLCGYHHRRAHDRAFDLSRLPSGEVRFRWRR